MLVLALAACGVNNAGDPVEPTRQLVGPAPPGSHADVYCSPITNDEPVTQECEVILRAGTDASEQQAVAWWFHAADVLRTRIGEPFSYQDQHFIYTSVFLDRRTTEGDWASVGWRCPQDASLAEQDALDAIQAHAPLEPDGFRTEQAARAAGCRIAVAQPGGATLAPGDPSRS